MSKAILVIDMPENCLECPLEYGVAVNNKILLNHNICNGCGKPNADSTKKPDWCPLRPMPEKKEELNLNAIMEKTIDKDEVWEGIFLSYMIDGYNACIDEIGGNNETDKETHQST